MYKLYSISCLMLVPASVFFPEQDIARMYAVRYTDIYLAGATWNAIIPPNDAL